MISAKTRRWERAEQKARGLRDSFDSIKQLQSRLEAKAQADNSEIEVAVAVEQFLAEVARLNRAEATQAKYSLTLGRLLKWCAAQTPPLSVMSELEVATLRRWIHSWGRGAYDPPQRIVFVTLGQRSNRAPNYMECQLWQTDFFRQFLENPFQVIPRIYESSILIREDEGFR